MPQTIQKRPKFNTHPDSDGLTSFTISQTINKKSESANDTNKPKNATWFENDCISGAIGKGNIAGSFKRTH